MREQTERAIGMACARPYWVTGFKCEIPRDEAESAQEFISRDMRILATDCCLRRAAACITVLVGAQSVPHALALWLRWPRDRIRVYWALRFHFLFGVTACILIPVGALYCLKAVALTFSFAQSRLNRLQGSFAVNHACWKYSSI